MAVRRAPRYAAQLDVPRHSRTILHGDNEDTHSVVLVGRPAREMMMPLIIRPAARKSCDDCTKGIAKPHGSRITGAAYCRLANPRGTAVLLGKGLQYQH